VTQEEDSLKRGSIPSASVHLVSHVSGSKFKGKFKGKKPMTHSEDKKIDKHDDYSGPKKNIEKKKPFKGKCNYCKRIRYKVIDSYKLKNKRDREGTQKQEETN
jgi:hypothetical protein